MPRFPNNRKNMDGRSGVAPLEMDDLQKVEDLPRIGRQSRAGII
jgi:hypothetical protein